MNVPSRSAIILICLGFCAGGLIATSQEAPNHKNGIPEWFTRFGPENNYQFAASDLDKLNVAQLEEIIRGDVFSRFPRVRVEFGSLKVEHGMFTISVVLFAPNHEVQAFLYKLMPDKKSWKITGAQRLWFVSPSQIVRGVRV